MLILGRKRGQSVHITSDDGTTIEVIIHKTSNGYVELGLIAPQKFTILRKELVDADGSTKKGNPALDNQNVVPETGLIEPQRRLAN